MYWRGSFLRLTAGLMLAFSTVAHAGLFDDEEARKAILELRQRVEANRQAAEAALQKQGEELRTELRTELRKASEENVMMRRSLLDLQSQIDVLKQDLASSRGQNEQFAKAVSDLQQRQKDLALALEERFRRFEPVKVAVDGVEFMADPVEKRDYEAAMATFRKGEFGLAEGAFGDFVRRYTQSGYVNSALFWLGNAQYANRDYDGAIRNFKVLLARAPEHARAAETALSIANCQIELKDTRTARKTLEDLIKAYPQSEAATAGRERLARLK